MNITEYTVEKLLDPTGILLGDRYEFFLQVELEEDDDLFNEDHLQLKVLFLVDETNTKVLNYHFYNSAENKYLDDALEDEELVLVENFCKEHYNEAEEQE